MQPVYNMSDIGTWKFEVSMPSTNLHDLVYACLTCLMSTLDKAYG